MDTTLSEHDWGSLHEALVHCSIQNWYPKFSKNTFKTKIVEIPSDVASWLVEDGIVLPNVDSAVRDVSSSLRCIMIYNR